MRRHESYTKPSAKKTLKALRARSRERRRVARLARYEARQDNMGWSR
jgi:ribosomal protein S21